MRDQPSPVAPLRMANDVQSFREEPKIEQQFGLNLQPATQAVKENDHSVPMSPNFME